MAGVARRFKRYLVVFVFALSKQNFCAFDVETNELFV